MLFFKFRKAASVKNTFLSITFLRNKHNKTIEVKSFCGIFRELVTDIADIYVFSAGLGCEGK